MPGSPVGCLSLGVEFVAVAVAAVGGMVAAVAIGIDVASGKCGSFVDFQCC